MGILDEQAQIEKIDKSKMLNKIQEIPDQLEIAYSDVLNFIIPTHYIKVKNVIIIGMGGSAIGGDLIKDLTKYNARVNVSVLRDYCLPAFVDSNTLVVGSTYSGETEETLEAFSEAVNRGAKCLAITRGGKISVICRKYKIPMFEIKYDAPPRAAIAYSLMPLLGIFIKLGFIEIDKEEIIQAIQYLRDYVKKIDIYVPSSQNEAKKLAQKIYEKLPTFIGSGILANVARRFKDQLNENAKNFGTFDELPELCHNHIIGLVHPNAILKENIVVMLHSKFDHPRNKLRQQILLQIFQKRGIKYESVMINQKGGAISEILHNVVFADFVSFYLAMLNDTDPTPIDNINLLKEKLAENK